MTQLKLVLGKAEFLNRRLPSGETDKFCVCKYNADLAWACISQVYGELIREVVENGGKYASTENIREYRKRGILDGRCFYCYAKGTGRGNWGRVTPKTIGELTRQEFEEKRPEIIRIGKLVECGHYFYRENLLNFFDLCKEYGARVVFPNKMLEFNEDVAKVLLETNSVLNFSICNDSLEPGAVSQGYTNLWRIKQAELYDKSGVNTTLTITCDITNSIQGNIEKGFSIEKALEAKEKGMTIRLLPLRLNSKKLCYETTGKLWDETVLPSAKQCKGTLDLFVKEHEWLFAKRGNNESYPLFFHPDFQNLVDNGIGVCGRIGDCEYCDKCNLQKEVRIKFPTSEIIPVVYNNKKPRAQINRRRVRGVRN
ncbi:MAG: hypothetical protein Q7R52_04150 [archaeon]|nr:hypothetical protein [archaeon]